ncbi:MAG: hypothetical protein PHF63_11990 [Herbinix sp.]|nr:hypothetical protein [Herbinix sp.]
MKLPIKTKKDWCITLIITFIALYYVSMNYDDRIENIMMKFSPVKMNIMNYPTGWGNLVLVGLIMTILSTIIMMIQKMSRKRILLIASLGFIFSISMFFGFMIHTNLIVGTSKTFHPTSIWINCYDKDINLEMEKDSTLAQKFLTSAISLKALTKSEQKEVKSQAEHQGENTYNIWISFPKKYGQSYDFIFYVQGDKIYSHHGMGTAEDRVFYSDNGFLELLQNIIKENQ